MTLTIWVDDWQMQCCGESFAPGDVVSWELLEVEPEDYADVVGSERAAEIDFREEHHGHEQHAPTRLQVLTIAQVHCRYEAPSGSTGKVQQPGAQPYWSPSEKQTGGQRRAQASASRATW